MKKNIKQQKKQGMALVVLLFYMVIAINVTAAAVIMLIINSQNALRSERGEIALTLAESATENAYLRALRDDAYTGETLTTGQGTTTIVITISGNTKTIKTTSISGPFTRSIEATMKNTNGVWSYDSWEEK